MRNSTSATNSTSPYLLSIYIVSGALALNVLLSLPANLYIMCLSVKELVRGQSTEIFVFNLAFIEVTFCTSIFPFVPLNFSVCGQCEAAVFFLGMVVIVGRPVFQCCICVERYLGVLHPLIFLKLKPMKYRVFCAALAWSLVLVPCLLVALNVVVLYLLVLPGCLFFFSVKLFTCLFVMRALKRPGPADDLKQRNGLNPEKIKAFRIIQLVLVSSVFTYAPLFIALVLYFTIDAVSFSLAWSTSTSIAIMAGFVQPCLYLKRLVKLPCF